MFSEGDTIVVFEEGSDRQDGTAELLAAEISGQCRCVALAVVNHDDDILMYRLFREGEELDAYNSSPGYWDWDGEGEEPGPTGGDPGLLAGAFGAEANKADIHAALTRSYDFEFERHSALCEALRVPAQAVGHGFADLAGGDAMPFDASVGHLVRVG